MPSVRSKLQLRAQFFEKARAFFQERSILEVDIPALSPFASIDEQIDVMQVCHPAKPPRYLFTSPEYGMKKLLCEGSGDIYQMCHVFREEEEGQLHSSEFTLVEWYRCNKSFSDFIDETLDFIRLFLPAAQKEEKLSYKEAFFRFASFDYRHQSRTDLLVLAAAHGIDLHNQGEGWSSDALLQLLFAELVEPRLQELTVITDYPSSQAALAQITLQEGYSVARRFEVYYKGIELANGYQELTDPVEQKKRLEEALERRSLLGKEPLPIDNSFIRALEKGLPNCCGVAVGFDRLLMLSSGAHALAEIL